MLNRRRAARAFLRLRTFDPDAAARAELLAEGVSAVRIQSLYGDEFNALVPHLIDDHLRWGVHESTLVHHCGRWYPSFNRLGTLLAMPDPCFPKTMTALPGQAGLDQLTDYLTARLSAEMSAVTERAAMMRVEGRTVAFATYRAHRLASQRSDLSSKEQRLADGLMRMVGQVLAL